MIAHELNPTARFLMGPGPSDVHPRVLQAMASPMIGHLDPQFIVIMDEVKEMLRNLFKTGNNLTFAISATGSAGMETCFINLLEPGDTAIVCVNGVFGARMCDIVERCGAKLVRVDAPWGSPIKPADVKKALEKCRPRLVAVVHAETSTGALSNIKQLSEIAHKHNCLVISDTVTSLGATDVYVDEWKLDAVYSCSQKGLACVAGMSPVSFSERAVHHIKNRKTQIKSWFNDLNLLESYWKGPGKRAYHHTAPSNQFYGLHEALLILKEEGIENAWRRHKENSAKFISKLKQIGLEPFVPEGERIPNLITVKIPDGIEEARVRSELLNKHNLEIGAGLGELAGKIWRIGLMGYNSNEKTIDYCISALKVTLNY